MIEAPVPMTSCYYISFSVFNQMTYNVTYNITSKNVIFATTGSSVLWKFVPQGTENQYGSPKFKIVSCDSYNYVMYWNTNNFNGSAPVNVKYESQLLADDYSFWSLVPQPNNNNLYNIVDSLSMSHNFYVGTQGMVGSILYFWNITK